jgi:PEP-CTERM motif
MSARKFILALVAVALAVSVSPAWAQYTFQSFNGPNSSGGTTANGINNNDQIVGFSVANGVNTNWWRNTNGTFNILNLPVGSFANGINTTPTVVGQNGATAFSYTGSTLTTLPNVNGTTTSQLAFGINDSGWIVGQYSDSNTGTSPGFVYNGTNFTTLNPVVNATNTFAQGINNNGLVAGFYSTDGNVTSHGFFYNTATSAFTLPADPNVTNFMFSQILGINDHGEAVGYYDLTNGTQVGFLYSTSSHNYTFLSDPNAATINGVMIAQITGIDNAGEITGFYIGADGLAHGFYATPTPEPSSLLLMGSGALGLLGIVRRKLLA